MAERDQNEGSGQQPPISQDDEQISGQSGQQPQRTCQSRKQERHLLLPGEHGLHGELRQCLEPRENRERESLRDEELC